MDVVLNGVVPARLFIDTGSTVTFITDNKARELGLATRTANQIEAMTSDGRKQSMPLVSLASLKAGSAEIRNVSVAILPRQQKAMPYLDGLLGMSFLSCYSFKIDYAKNRLILEPHS